MLIFARSIPLWEQKVITRSNLGLLIQHKHHFLPPQKNGTGSIKPWTILGGATHNVSTVTEQVTHWAVVDVGQLEDSDSDTDTEPDSEVIIVGNWPTVTRWVKSDQSVKKTWCLAGS